MAMNSDTKFEKTFSDLAIASLQDKSPALMDYLVGFQVLDVNDDQTKAVGVFGCQVGNELIYLPVFFMNGELKGSELMYLKNQDIFCPNNEGWVSYLLHRKPYKVGEPSKYTNSDLSGTGMNLMPFRLSPQNFGKVATFVKTKANFVVLGKNTKKASIGVPAWGKAQLQEWTQPFVRASGKSISDNMYKQAQSRLDLMSVMESMTPADLVKVAGCLRSDAQFVEVVDRFYPIEKIVNVKKAAAKEPSRVEDVEIKSINEVSKWDEFNMSDADKTKLMSGEVLIKDHRNNTSKVYKATTEVRAQSPDTTGHYEVFTKDGKSCKCFVVVSPVSVNKDGGPVCCSPYSSPKRYLGNNLSAIAINLDGDGLWRGTLGTLHAKYLDNGLPLSERFSKYTDVSNMEVGNCYAVVNNRGSSSTGTAAFYVVSKTKNSDGTVFYKVSTNLTPSKHEKETPSDWDCGQIIVDNRDVGTITKITDTVFVSKNCKAVPVKVKEPKRDDNGYVVYPQPVNYGMEEPADLKDVEAFIWRAGFATPLKLYSNGTEFSITVGGIGSAIKTAELVSARDTLKQLTGDYGIAGDIAQAMMKEAAANSHKLQAKRYSIAFADGYPKFFQKKASDPYMSSSMGAPGMNMSMGQSSDPSLGVAATSPVAFTEAIPSLRPSMSNNSMYNPDPQLDKKPYQAAQNAAKTGQKEVFDTALISTLIKSVDSNRLIDKYISDLIMGMDRIGRIYFLYLQHNEDFEDRYGDDDILELEDNLRNTFKSVGDLIMFLKQKTVEDKPTNKRTEINF